MPAASSVDSETLSAQLARTKQALDRQSARVTELELLLAEEREARVAESQRLAAESRMADFEHLDQASDAMSDGTMLADQSAPAMTALRSVHAQLSEAERQCVEERERADAACRAQQEANGHIERLTAQVQDLEASRSVLAQRLAEATQGQALEGHGKSGDRPSTAMTLKASGGTAFMSALGVVVLGLSVMGLLNEYAVKDS